MPGKRKARLILCSGKGGTGKSTVAAAIGIHFSGEGKKVLLVSSDPTHSLSGIFNKRLTGNVAKINSKLYATELDVEKIAKKVEQQYRRIFVNALASWLDEEIIEDLPVEILSGVDELFALDKIRYFVDKDYDVVVWDTSPTAYTLRLLSMSQKLSEAVSRSLGLYVKLAHPIQTLKALFKRAPEPEILTAFKKLGEVTKNIEAMLSDARTELILVLNPEKLPIQEGKQLRAAAERYNIALKRLVVNKMMLPCKCQFCTIKRNEQQKNLEVIHKEYGDLKILTVPYFPHEVISKKRVEEYAGKLFEE